jgi:predicted regulator of Ras-like GTPase activity (Roadblock/LC7/MglB family)
MGFREHLQEVCRGVDGAFSCSLMGMDGIEVDRHVQADAGVDVQSMMVEMTGILRSAREAAEAHAAGGLAEFTLGTDRLLAVGRLVSPDYFLVVALGPGGNQGKARYLLRVTAPQVLAEL